MNRTKHLYRVGLVGSALAFLGAAVSAFLPIASAWPLALALGMLGTLATGHLRMRMHMATQRKSDAALRSLLLRDSGLGALSESVAKLHTDVRTIGTDVALATDDIQASVAATESFLLAELATLRQRIATARETTSNEIAGSAAGTRKLLDGIETSNERHRWMQSQFQQLRTQLEHLPSDAGEYSTLRRLLVSDDAALPQLGGWAISSSTVDSLVHTALLADGPRTIVELGSGASTLWMAHALRHRGLGGHIHSLDHLEEYGAKTRALLAAHGLSDYATVHIAPLVPVDLKDQTYHWYDLDQLPLGFDIDLLLVDGPPAGTTDHTRYPAVPRLADRLADEALVYLDDTIRTDEKQVIRDWLSEFPTLTQEAQLPKSTILRWKRAAR